MNITELYNENERIIAGSIIILMSAVGLITHSISLVYMAKTSLFYNAFGYLCMSNAIASILSVIEMLLYCGPVTIMSYDPIPLNYIYILGHISDGLSYVTSYTHIFKSINRYYAICKPLFYNQKATKNRIYAAILIVWLISFIQASPFFLDDCSYYYDSDIMVWMYTKSLCGKIMDLYIDFILSSIQMVLVLFLDTWTNYIETMLYIFQNIAFFIIAPRVPLKWGNFFTSNLVWIAILMLNGIIMAVFTRMICTKKIYQNEHALQVQNIQHGNQLIKIISNNRLS